MKTTLTTLCLIAAATVTLHAKTANATQSGNPGGAIHPPSFYNQRLPTHSPAPSNPKDARNRAAHPLNGGGTSATFHFKQGAQPHLYDGLAHDRGAVTSKGTKINYGQQRRMIADDGKPHQYYYAFGPKLTNGQHASGWVWRGDIAKNERPAMPKIASKPAPGRMSTYLVKTRAESRGLYSKYAGLKVTKNTTAPHQAPTDYLTRRGYTNMLYNLPGKGGVATDTFRGGATFHRAQSVHSRDVPLYRRGGNHQVGAQKYVFGYVNTPGERRWGWMAYDALKHRPRQ